jgi:hypothetical protein
MIWEVIVLLLMMCIYSGVRKSRRIKIVLFTEVAIILLASSKIVCRMTQNIFGMIQFPWRWYILLVPVSVIGFVELIDIIGKKSAVCFLAFSVVLAILTESMTLTRTVFVNCFSQDNISNYSGGLLENAVELLDTLYIPISYFTEETDEDICQVRDDTGNELEYTRNDNAFVVTSIHTGETDFSITFPLFMYIGYSAENLLTGDSYAVTESRNGLVQVNIQNYNGGDIRLYYKGTIGQKVSLAVSGICACVLLGYFALCSIASVKRNRMRNIK